MTNISKSKIIALIIALALAYYAGLSSNNEVIKREVLEIEKEIIVNRDVVRYIEHPDGRKETIVDNSTRRSTSREIKLIEQIPVNRRWLIGLSANLDSGLKLMPEYTLSVDYKLFKDVYIGASYGTDSVIGIGVKISF